MTEKVVAFFAGVVLALFFIAICEVVITNTVTTKIYTHEKQPKPEKIIITPTDTVYVYRGYRSQFGLELSEDE